MIACPNAPIHVITRRAPVSIRNPKMTGNSNKRDEMGCSSKVYTPNKFVCVLVLTYGA